MEISNELCWFLIGLTCMVWLGLIILGISATMLSSKTSGYLIKNEKPKPLASEPKKQSWDDPRM